MLFGTEFLIALHMMAPFIPIFDDPEDDPEAAADETIYVEFWNGSSWVDRTNQATYVETISYSRNPPHVALTANCTGLF